MNNDILYCPVCVSTLEFEEGVDDYECLTCKTTFSLGGYATQTFGESQSCMVFCPVCSSARDARSMGLINMRCSSCGQEYGVLLHRQTVAEFAMFG